jgi:hypothetical protein
MRRARFEALEDRKLFSVTDLIMDPFDSGVLDNNAATDDMSLSVVAGARAITVNPATLPNSVRPLPIMEEEGIYPGFAVAKDEAITISQGRAAVTFGDLLVSSYAGRSASRTESVGKDESLTVGKAQSWYFILPNGELLASPTLARQAADGLASAAIDQVMSEWGREADAILHEDNEFSFPRMVRGNGGGSVGSDHAWGSY